jgi:protein TonB
MNRTVCALSAVVLGFSIAAAQSGPARISGGVMAGQNLTKVAPVYPAEARAAHVSGAVVLHAIIGKDGTVENLTVISGPEMLRASALDAVRQWTYKPYLLNGEPTEVDTTITVNYNFGGETPSPAAAPSDSPSQGR